MAAKTIFINNNWAAAVLPAVTTLRGGGVLVFPTETVYGIGVAAGRADALEKIRRLKQRPDEKPFQLLAADIEMAERRGAQFGPIAQRLADAFWPGPLTLVVPNGKDAEGGTLGIRVPASELILAICRSLGEPIISSSANPAGAPPPADAVTADCFGNEVDLLIAAETAAAGIPSTVVRCFAEDCEILREGGIAKQDIDAVRNGEYSTSNTINTMKGNAPCPK